MARILFLLSLILAVLSVAPAARAAQDFPPALDQVFESAKESMMANPAETLRRLERAEALAKRLSDERQRTLALATTRWLAAEAYWRTNDVDAAVPLVADGLRLIEPIIEPIKLRGDLLHSRGILHMQKDRAALALADFQRAYRVFQRIGDPRSQSIVLQTIGTLYSAANDNDRAERYYRQASEVYDGDPALSLSLHNRRGNVLLVLERYGEAEIEYRLALKAARTMGKPLLEARVLGNLARNQVEGGRFDAADRTLARGFALTRDNDALAFREQFLATAARLAQGRGQLQRARQLISQAFEGVDTRTTSWTFHEAHLYAYQIFARTGDARRALEHLEALRRLEDEAAQVAISTNSALMAARFDYANQELRIANLKAEELRRNVAYEQARARWQRIIFYGLGGATLVVIALLSFGVITLRRSRNRVRAANEQLEQSNAALQKALAAKTEFLATTSHEIRTPLNGILGMTQVMLADTKLGDDMRDRIGVVHGAGMTMRALVDDILDLAKMETGNMTVDPAPMDLAATLRDVSRMWEEQARAKGVGFGIDTADAPGWIVSDAGRLRQMVFNLLSNALKFTAEGEVTLRAAAIETKAGRRLHVSVADTGIGIPAEKCEEIFESFKQADAGTTRRYGGTGLGLTICRNLARALGGDIAVRSRPGEGSVFTVDLPLVEAEAPASTAPEPGGAGAVLVVERNPIARSMLRTVLRARVATVRFAGTGAEAEGALRERGVAIVVADEATLRAENADAVAALAELVRTAGEMHAATLALWSLCDAEVAEALAATGVGDVLTKPVKPESLIEAIFAQTERNSPSGHAGPLVSRAA